MRKAARGTGVAAFSRAIRYAAVAFALVAVSTCACSKDQPAAPAQPGTSATPQAASPAEASQPASVTPATNAASTMPAGTAPKYRCDEPVYQFPQTWKGTPVLHTWIVHNDGESLLEIREVKPACGCTVAEYDKVVQPGGQGKISAKFDTSEYDHEVTKTIDVQTNDPRASQVSIALKGLVKARISMDPPTGFQWGSGSFPPGVPLVRTVKLTSNVDMPVKLERGSLPPPSPFTCEIKEVTPGKEYELTVTADRSQLKEGSNASKVTLKTGLAEEPNLVIPVNLHLQPIIQVNPLTLALATPVNGSLRREITLIYNGGGPMKITQVSATDPAIKVRAEEMPPAPAPNSQPASGTASPKPPETQPAAGASWKILVEFEDGWDPSLTPQTTPQQTQPASLPQAKPGVTRPSILITALTDVKEKPKVDIRLYTYTQTVVAESLVGKRAPVCTIKDINGKDIKLGGQNGNVVVTVFWTSWCPHCKRMLPLLQKAAELYADKGVVFNLISMDTATPTDKIKGVLGDLNVRLPFALDAVGTSGKRYGANRFPITFVVGRTGIVEAVNNGCPANFGETLKTQIGLLLEGKNRSAFPKLVAATQPALTLALPPPLDVASPAGILRGSRLPA